MKLVDLIDKIKANLKSGITVSLISIPLSVSLAVASNASPVAGIITAIWAGLVASVFGGSNYNIVGPTGALSGLLAMYAISYGEDVLPILAILTGIVVLVAFIFKLERFLVLIPKSVIVGFTLGVAFIIGLNQLNSAFGLSVPVQHEKFIENLMESFHHIGSFSPSSFFVFLVFLMGLFVLAKLMPRFPGAIILAPIGIILGYLSVNSHIPLAIKTLGDKYPEIYSQLFIPISFEFSPSLIPAALTVGMIAIIETMLSAKIADGMTKTKHDRRKELLGLGLANLASGICGGIPATAALARTALNIKTGATHKISATINSIFVFVISFFLLSTFKYIPLAVIAAILVFVAVRMVELKEFVQMFRQDKISLVIALIVALVTVYEDPIVGILLGTAAALLVLVYRISQGQFEVMVNSFAHGRKIRIIKDGQISLRDCDVLVYTIKGKLVYINSQSHISRFENMLDGGKKVILRLRELYYIDIDGVEAIDEIIEICHRKGCDVYITGVNEFIQTMLEGSPNFLEIRNKGMIYQKTTEVLDVLGIKPGRDTQPCVAVES